ncbi:MAG TPA: PKD domain-containing protein [Blastocatellia bacterium]|nr:PKD domain-containing protein [Blastocatellia bacterium]
MNPRHERLNAIPVGRDADASRQASSHRFRILILTAVLISGLLAAFATLRLAQAAQEQPVGPGLPRTGSAGPKSAASSSKAGSILFFHKFTSDRVRPAETNTLLTITNTNPRDSVAVRLFFLASCQADDQVFNLGPSQTRTLLMSRERPGASGYAVAMAVNSEGTPTQFNWLIGSASVRDGQGHEYSYNAFAVAKRTAGPVRLNVNYEGELNFDGLDYDRLPKRVAIDNIPFQGIQENTSLNTELDIYSPSATLDSGDYSPVKITATAYDQSGRAYGEVFDNICGLSTSLSEVWTETPINEVITAGRPGWASFSANALESGEPSPVLGLSLTEKVGGAPWRSARNMQVLEWLDKFTMKIAVAPVTDPPPDSATQDLPDATGDSEGASETKTGSILIFSRYITTDGSNTLLNLTNTDPSQKIRVRLFFSNQATASQISDRIINLAPNQTTTLDLADIAGDQRGWVMAVAIDAGGRPTQFNHLIGSAQVIEGPDSGAASAAYNALAVAKNSVGPVTRNDDAESADLLFDDVNYDRLPATSALAAVPNQDDSSTTLGFARPPSTLLNGVNIRGSIFATLYDDAFSTSAATLGRTENVLGALRSNGGQHFTSIIGKGHRGWLKMLSATPLFAWSNTLATTPFSAADNIWNGSLSGGGNLHYLTASEVFRIVAPASNPNNHLPVASAEPIGPVIEARRATGTIVRLDASASSDEDLDPLTYQWTDNDQRVSDSRVTDLRLGLGLHNVSLTVTDSSGATSIPFEQIVEVRDTTPPQMSGLPSSIIRNTTSITGAAIDYRLPVAYDMVDGWVTVTATRAPGSNFPLGTTVVNFTAKDKAGNTATAFMTVTVILDSREAQSGGTPGSIAPVMENINDQYIPAGTIRNIPLKATDLDNDPVTFSLIGAGPNAQIVDVDAAARQATLRIAAGANDPVTEIRVVATDSRRLTFRTLPFRVFVNDIPNDETGSGKKLTNRPPTARVEPLPSAIQATGKDGAEVKLDGSKSTDPDGDNLTFVWTDNGQQIAQGATATIKLAAGQHSIVLTVSDGSGGVSSSQAVSVEVLPRSLTITSASPNRLQRGTQVTMTITGAGIVPGTQVKFSKTGINVISYQSVEEDQIVARVQILSSTAPGFCDIYFVTPTGRSVRLRSGCFINP